MWTVILIIGIVNRDSETKDGSYTSNSTTPTTNYQSATTSTDSEVDYKALFATEMKDDNVFYQDYVNNDVTGRWRLCEVYSTEKVADHAVTYYRAYFEDDNEIHAVINFMQKTTLYP